VNDHADRFLNQLTGCNEAIPPQEI
jgi:hypothetical protein